MGYRQFTHLDLVSPYPLPIDGVGHVLSPTLRDIVLSGGEQVYNSRISILLMTKVQLLQALTSVASEQEVKKIQDQQLFDIMMAIEYFRNGLIDSLNFFLQQEVYVSDDGTFIQTSSGSYNFKGKITAQTFVVVKDLILKRNYITPPKQTKAKRRSKKMIQFDKKLQQGRKKSKKYKQQRKAMQLGNLVSKISKYSNLNIVNVFDLTVYQLYDQFFQIGTQVQLQAATMRWCIWGQDKYDFSQWYKFVSEK